MQRLCFPTRRGERARGAGVWGTRPEAASARERHKYTEERKKRLLHGTLEIAALQDCVSFTARYSRERSEINSAKLR
jgi:putative NADPH-quinone reductase